MDSESDPKDQYKIDKKRLAEHKRKRNPYNKEERYRKAGEFLKDCEYLIITAGEGTILNYQPIHLDLGMSIESGIPHYLDDTQFYKDFPEYRLAAYTEALAEAVQDGNIRQIMYIPTEAGIPITEAGRFAGRGSWIRFGVQSFQC